MNKLMVVAALLAGCGKKDEGAGGGGGGGGGACKPLTVTVDGTALAAMPHGLARSNNMAQRSTGDITYEVQMFNHDKSTCEEMVSKSGRTIPDGEVSVRAFAGGGGMMGAGVGIDAHTQAGDKAKLVSAKPKANGDIVKICVSEMTFTPRMGDYKDKKVSVSGAFEGKYCGELKW